MVSCIQYIKSWSDKLILITADWIILWGEFVKTWSMKVAVLSVILVGTDINCSKE